MYFIARPELLMDDCISKAKDGWPSHSVTCDGLPDGTASRRRTAFRRAFSIRTIFISLYFTLLDPPLVFAQNRSEIGNLLVLSIKRTSFDRLHDYQLEFRSLRRTLLTLSLSVNDFWVWLFSFLLFFLFWNDNFLEFFKFINSKSFLAICNSLVDTQGDLIKTGFVCID